MQPEVIPELPKILDNERFDIDNLFVKEEFKTAANKFVFYDNEQGECRFLFHELDESLFAALVIKLCEDTHHKLFEFLKLVLEAVRLLKKNNKKDYQLAVKIEKHIKNQNF